MEMFGKIFARVGAFRVGDFFGGAFRDDFSATRAAFWAEVNDIVGTLNNVEIVFNDDHRIAAEHELLQNFYQFFTSS